MNTTISEVNLEQPIACTTSVQVKTPVVITENASVSKPYQMKECNVCNERLPATTSTPAAATNNCLAYNMRTRPPKVETPHRTSNRPHTIVDYSKFMTGTEDDTSPPLQEAYGGPETNTKQFKDCFSKLPHQTSTAPRPIRRKEPSTIMKAASSEETKVTIEALLSLGNDVIPENDITAENSALVPIGINAPPTVNDNLDTVKDSQNDVSNQPTPLAPIPAPAQTPQLECTDDDLTANKDTTELTDSQTTSSDGASAKKEKKGTLVTKNFTLPRRVRPTRSFKCGVEKCNQVFSAVKDLNQHHWDKHLPVKCNMCIKYFSCPNEMLKHKYKHYEVMFECAICEKGFTFESQYVAHKMKHHKSPGHQCIKCQKWFMRSSELNAHLITHGKKYTYCTEPGCDYKNKDPRNVRAHARRHSDVQSFKCPKCDKVFRWCVQRKRHLDNNCK